MGSVCKGRGCCTLCDRGDYWDDLVYCSNKNCNHVAHYACCDNLSAETVKFIKHYYCPKCRLDGNFEVTFYAKTSAAKQNEKFASNQRQISAYKKQTKKTKSQTKVQKQP